MHELLIILLLGKILLIYAIFSVIYISCVLFFFYWKDY